MDGENEVMVCSISEFIVVTRGGGRSGWSRCCVLQIMFLNSLSSADAQMLASVGAVAARKPKSTDRLKNDSRRALSAALA